MCCHSNAPNILCFHPLRRLIIIFLHKIPFTHTRRCIGRKKISPHSNAFCSRSSLIVYAKTLSSYCKLQGSFSHKSYYTHMHFTHTNTLTKEWNMVYEVLWQSTIAHCQWSVITLFSFRFTPMKLPLALRVMQNPDKCKNATQFSQTGITVPTDYHLSLCLLLALTLIFHLQCFVSSCSPHWPCKSLINFHFQSLTTESLWKVSQKSM